MASRRKEGAMGTETAARSWADLTVYARDFPEPRLFVTVAPAVASPPEEDPLVRRMAKRMWAARCHHGLVVTPERTYVLRDTFETLEADSIRVTSVLPTKKLMERVGDPPSPGCSEGELELLVEKWLGRLIADYEATLPDDPKVAQALFPELIGAAAEGRVVHEGPFG
jgi:hypothetical protein